MVQTVSYPYGNGGFTLSSAQMAKLKQILNEVMSSDLTKEGEGVPIYEFVLSLISDGGKPLAGVDPNVFAWIDGAAGVNADTTASGHFIREYTTDIYTTRYGTPPTNAQLNLASNEIAIGLAQGILFYGGELPSIEGLGAIDAGYSAAQLFVNPPDPGSGVYSPWAGTLLFPLLNVPDFYTKWLLNMDQVQGPVVDTVTGKTSDVMFKSVAGSYDIIAALEAYFHTVENHPLDSGFAYLQSLFSYANGNPASLVSSTQSFFLESYGLTAGQVPGIGTGTPFGSALSLATSPNYVAGIITGSSLAAPLVIDTNLSPLVTDVVNAGPGNDMILVVASDGLIDGGGGSNVADYSQWFNQGPLTITLEIPYTPFFSYRLEVDTSRTLLQPVIYTDYLYDVQTFVGDAGGDTLNIPALPASSWAAIGSGPDIDLGLTASNVVELESNGAMGPVYFSVAGDASSDTFVVSAVAGSDPLPPSEGVSIEGLATIEVVAGSEGTVEITGDFSDSLGLGNAIQFLGGLGSTIDASAMTSRSPVEILTGSDPSNIILGPDELLKLDDPTAFTGTISDLGIGDVIDVSGIEAANATLTADDMLTIGQGGASELSLQLDASESFNGLAFDTEPDDEGGTDITVSMAAATMADQTVTVDAPVLDSSTGETITYSVNVNFTPTEIQFPAYRTDGPTPDPVTITATYLGGDPDPDTLEENDVSINDAVGSGQPFYLFSGFAIGPLTPVGTGTIYIDAGLDPPHDYSDTILPLSVDYDGSSTEINLTVGVKVYAPAVPEFFMDGEPDVGGINFGTIHLGQTVSMDVEIANTATGDLTDTLSSSPGTLGQFTSENGVDGIAAGDEGTVTVNMTGDVAGNVLVLDSSPLFNLVSQDSDLPDETVGEFKTPVLEGSVYYYANPIFSNSEAGETVGVLTQDDASDWTLDLGTVTAGFYGDLADIAVENATPSYAYSDTLTGTVDFTASADGGFIQDLSSPTGQQAFGGGGWLSLGVVESYGSGLGPHTETVVFQPTGSNSSGFSQALPDITLTVTDNVVLPDIPGATVVDDGTTVTVTVAAGDDAVLDPLFLAGPLVTLVIEGPGMAEIDGDASVSTLEISAGGILLLEGAVVTTDPVTIDAGGNITGFGTITGGETVNGTVTASGGALEITGAISGAGTLTFAAGASLQLDDTVAPTETLQFNAADETLILGAGADVLAPITGYAAGDAIALAGQQIATALYDAGTHKLAITGSGGGTYSLIFSGNYQQSDFPVVGGAVEAPCFLSGTRIMTPAGEVAVQDLAVGDQVLAHFAGIATIRWIGHRYVDCRRHPEPQKVWPVRIGTGAFGDGIPISDLWLSPDHAVFVSDVLIPIRLLANGATIVQEPMDRVTYFHVELPRHDVLTVEGLPAESYLDSGNRAMFANAGTAMMLHPDFATASGRLQSWDHHTCAPLVLCPEAVEPIWRRLTARAEALGHSLPEPGGWLDPHFRLRTHERELVPLTGHDGWHVFVLPPGTDAVHLISGSHAPAERFPWLDDRRRLGVPVERIRVSGDGQLVEIPVDHPSLRTGWHSVERENDQLWRWTDGGAQLPLPIGAAVVEIQLAG